MGNKILWRVERLKKQSGHQIEGQDQLNTKHLCISTF